MYWQGEYNYKRNSCLVVFDNRVGEIMKIRIRKCDGEVSIVKAEPVSMDKDPDGHVYYMMKVIEGEYADKLTVKVYESDVIYEEGDTIV